MMPPASGAMRPAPRKSCLSTGRTASKSGLRMLPRALTLSVLLLGAACTRQSAIPDEAPDVMIAAEYRPSPPTVGEGEMTLAFVDSSGAPVLVSALSLKADMTHPGMTPWLADVDSLPASQFTLPVSWSMAGDWILQIEADLSDGRRLRRTLPARIEPAGEPVAD